MSATRAVSLGTRTDFTVSSTGDAFGLQVKAGTVSFCDKRGGRKLDLVTGRDIAFERACQEDGEPNVACGGLAFEVTVRTPGLGPSDVVDVGAQSFSLDGHVHDCAEDGNVVAILT